ncbi:hypothetical protein [Paracoccus sp. ME4]|uniref:hypothetical protein n=1 Tax=Paracoccus sp. ME4 TaxID=3138066 RepID=UPI00398AC7E6
MDCNTDMRLGRYGESDARITVLVSGIGAPPAAQIVLEAGYWRKAVSVTLDADEMGLVVEALGEKDGRCRIEGGGMEFRISSQNRGEPYRDGFSLSLGEIGDYESTACWMDERDAEDLATLVRERLQAEPECAESRPDW